MATPGVETHGVTPSAVSHDTQCWTYQPNGKCDYHDGSNVVHFDAGTLQNYATRLCEPLCGGVSSQFMPPLPLAGCEVQSVEAKQAR